MNNSSTIRSFARDSLAGNWLNAILASLIFSGVISVVSAAYGVVLLIMGVLLYGLYLYYLTLTREKISDFNVLFKAFSFSGQNLGLFGKTLGVYLLLNLFVFLWSLLLIIPGIVASYSYRMAFYLLIDDPEIGVSEALRKSKEMMNGYKAKLFYLDLSFIGWVLLSILTFGIGFLWLTPYMITSQAIFYDELLKELGLTFKIKNDDVDDIDKTEPKVGGVVK